MHVYLCCKTLRVSHPLLARCPAPGKFTRLIWLRRLGLLFPTAINPFGFPPSPLSIWPDFVCTHSPNPFPIYSTPQP